MNINNELERLNQNFNDKIDSSDHGFSLTKMFKKEGLLNSITKGALMFSMSLGAFSNIVNAKENTEQLVHSAQATQSIQQEKQQEMFGNDSLKELTPDMLEHISQNELSGVWKLPTTGETVIVTSNGKFTSDNPQESLEVQSFLMQHDIDTTQENINPESSVLYGTDVKVLNLNKDFYSENMPDFLNKEDFPIMHEYQNEIVAHHEYNHIESKQLEAYDSLSEVGRKNFTGLIMREVNSDVYATLALIKSKDFDFEKGMDFIQEHAELREKGFTNNLDIGHSTHIGLYALKDYFKENPNSYETLKNGSYDNLNTVSSQIALETFKQIDNMGFVSGITRDDFAQDLEKFVENGRTLDKETSVVYEKMAEMTSVDGEKVLNNTGYEDILNKMADKYESREGMTFEKASRSVREGKRYARGLTQVKLIDGFEDGILNQTALNNVIDSNMPSVELDQQQMYAYYNVFDNAFEIKPENTTYTVEQSQQQDLQVDTLGIKDISDEIKGIKEPKASDPNHKPCEEEIKISKEIDQSIDNHSVTSHNNKQRMKNRHG